MGFYIRKGFNFGPLRLNLSRSGLGASFGIKGARIGVGPKGSYIHMGRGGVYYRQSLNLRSPSDLPTLSTGESFLQEVESGDVSKMSDESSMALLKELNRVNNRFEFLPFFLVLTIIALISLFYYKMDRSYYTVLFTMAIPALIFIRHLDVTYGTAVINYELDPEASGQFSLLQSSFNKITSCERVWHIPASGKQSDWKRNAGAKSTVKRKTIRPTIASPPRVVSNLKIPALPAARQTLYFFPDRLLVYDRNKVGAISYFDLVVETRNTRFIEEEIVPRDSQVVDNTWLYVNKNGDPDRRFSGNRKLPIALYGEIYFSSNSGLSELFQCSQPEAIKQFADTISKKAEALNKVKIEVSGLNRTLIFKQMMRELEIKSTNTNDDIRELSAHAKEVLQVCQDRIAEFRDAKLMLKSQFEGLPKDCSIETIKNSLGVLPIEIQGTIDQKDDTEDIDKFIHLSKTMMQHQYERASQEGKEKAAFKKGLESFLAEEKAFNDCFSLARKTLGMFNDISRARQKKDGIYTPPI